MAYILLSFTPKVYRPHRLTVLWIAYGLLPDTPLSYHFWYIHIVNGSQITITYTGWPCLLVQSWLWMAYRLHALTPCSMISSRSFRLWMAYRLHEQQRPAQSRKGRQLWMAYGLYASTPLTVSMNGMTRLWIARRLLSLTPIFTFCSSVGELWMAYRNQKKISERKIPSLLAGFFYFYSTTIFCKTFRSPDLSIETLTQPINFDNDVILIEVISFNSFTVPLDVSLCKRRR